MYYVHDEALEQKVCSGAMLGVAFVAPTSVQGSRGRIRARSPS